MMSFIDNLKKPNEKDEVKKMYEWKDSYDQGNISSNVFIKGVLKFLKIKQY